MRIEDYIHQMIFPYISMRDQAINNYFKEFNQKYSTTFNCIFFNGRAYSSASYGEPHKYITSEYADKIQDFESVFNIEEEAYHLQRKLSKYLVKLDKNTHFESNIPKEWVLSKEFTPTNPERYKEILGEKDSQDLAQIIQKCIVMRLVA